MTFLKNLNEKQTKKNMQQAVNQIKFIKNFKIRRSLKLTNKSKCLFFLFRSTIRQGGSLSVDQESSQLATTQSKENIAPVASTSYCTMKTTNQTETSSIADDNSTKFSASSSKMPHPYFGTKGAQSDVFKKCVFGCLIFFYLSNHKRRDSDINDENY